MAKRLAKEFGRMYVDLDEEIVRKTGRTIPEIFATGGETEFRRIESVALREAKAPIVALGGGTLLDPENRAWAEANGFVVVIDADEETIAQRIEAAKGARPLGNKLAERRAHYESFAHHLDEKAKIILPRPLRGRITPPPSKSHLHRLLIASFLAGVDMPIAEGTESDDIVATRRCAAALKMAMSSPSRSAVLFCGESGSTLRFFAPIAAALRVKATFVKKGRLAERPMIEYSDLKSGVHELRGDVSSQFVTGLLFALPLLDGDSEIRFTTPLKSRGYVEMTLRVLKDFSIKIEQLEDGGFRVKGSQRYIAPKEITPEADWSGAAFWYAANALGSDIDIAGLDDGSAQPDRVVGELVRRIVEANKSGSADEIDVSECPDNYPALAAVNHALGGCVRFTGTERLRLKESDRIAAMEGVFASPCDVDPRGDHRIAMAAAILAMHGDSPAIIHDAWCVSKSYPGFWDELKMDLYCVTGWPLLKTRSPELHNAAYAKEGRKAEMVSHPAETIEEALRFAEMCDVRGMAVTIPHKESVIAHLDSIDDAARDIGAVNTVVFKDGKKRGYNTDEPGFAEAICAFVGKPSLAGITVALLGDGGAAKAVDCALERLGAARVEVFHRRALDEEFDLIVNATPVDPIPEYEFTGREMVYDLRYVPEETPLMARARAKGCRVENGFSMLIAQARLQREHFFA